MADGGLSIPESPIWRERRKIDYIKLRLPTGGKIITNGPFHHENACGIVYGSTDEIVHLRD